MATTTRSGKAVFKSKSDHARALFAEGKSVVEVTQTVPGMGYAFAYGIAKRAGFNLTAATRRATKSVTTVGDDVIVEIVTPEGTHIGTVTVNRATGKVTTRKVKSA